PAPARPGSPPHRGAGPPTTRTRAAPHRSGAAPRAERARPALRRHPARRAPRPGAPPAPCRAGPDRSAPVATPYSPPPRRLLARLHHPRSLPVTSADHEYPCCTRRTTPADVIHRGPGGSTFGDNPDPASRGCDAPERRVGTGPRTAGRPLAVP